MSILVDGSTKVICQGITGTSGAFHTKGCFDYGTKMVGGTTPGKGGTKDANGLPIFDTVQDAVDATGATASMIFVPPPFAADAILEAANAGVEVVCCITEGIPVQDMVRTKHILKEFPDCCLIGPNCPGIITQAFESTVRVLPPHSATVARSASCPATSTWHRRTHPPANRWESSAEAAR